MGAGISCVIPLQVKQFQGGAFSRDGPYQLFLQSCKTNLNLLKLMKAVLQGCKTNLNLLNESHASRLYTARPEL